MFNFGLNSVLPTLVILTVIHPLNNPCYPILEWTRWLSGIPNYHAGGGWSCPAPASWEWMYWIMIMIQPRTPIRIWFNFGGKTGSRSPFFEHPKRSPRRKTPPKSSKSAWEKSGPKVWHRTTTIIFGQFLTLARIPLFGQNRFDKDPKTGSQKAA